MDAEDDAASPGMARWRGAGRGGGGRVGEASSGRAPRPAVTARARPPVGGVGALLGRHGRARSGQIVTELVEPEGCSADRGNWFDVMGDRPTALWGVGHRNAQRLVASGRTVASSPGAATAYSRRVGDERAATAGWAAA